MIKLQNKLCLPKVSGRGFHNIYFYLKFQTCLKFFKQIVTTPLVLICVMGFSKSVGLFNCPCDQTLMYNIEHDIMVLDNN